MHVGRICQHVYVTGKTLPHGLRHLSLVLLRCSLQESQETGKMVLSRVPVSAFGPVRHSLWNQYIWEGPQWLLDVSKYLYFVADSRHSPDAPPLVRSRFAPRYVSDRHGDRRFSDPRLQSIAAS